MKNTVSANGAGTSETGVMPKAVQDFFTAYNAKDREGYAAVFTEDAIYRCPALGLAWNGRDEGAALFEGYLGAVPDRSCEVVRTIGSGDVVVVEFLWRAVSNGGLPGLPPKGETVEFDNLSLFELRDGLICRFVEYLGRHKGFDIKVGSLSGSDLDVEH
jgi:steroid delta-isomerase-like uncharacterized protein